MINLGDEIIRISPKDDKRIEYSKDGGRSWLTRYMGGCGEFEDLTDNGKEVLAQTSKGLYYSKDDGKSWLRRS